MLRSTMALLIATILLSIVGTTFAAEIAKDQKQYLENKRYAVAPQPPNQLVNTDSEPDLEEGFVDMFNGKDLAGWSVQGGTSKYSWKNGKVVGVCDPEAKANSFLVSNRADYGDFIFTCDFRWVVPGNSGIQFRSFIEEDRIKGYQCEFDPSERGWTGGIYGEAFGSWKYCLWLTEHDKVRECLKSTGWNRVTISCQGDSIKTWINGVGCSNLVNDELATGFFGLQIHKGAQGTVHWRNVKIKELK